MELKVGDMAPEFTLPDQDGDKHNLNDYLGNWVLLYFYPRDNTPGCATEACTIGEKHTSFTDLDAVVLGVSTDSVQSHDKFAAKYNLPFAILADEDKEVVKAYGVWQPKKMMGKEFMGTRRMSFLINPKGRIAKIYAKVKPSEHAGEVLADLKELTR